MKAAYSLRSVADLERPDHVCSIVQSEEERQVILIPFLEAGLRLGERVLCVVDTTTPAAVLDGLNEVGIDPLAFLASGQLSVVAPDQMHILDGQFDPHTTIELLCQDINASRVKGFNGLRLATEMSWALRNYRGSERLVEFESQLNTLLSTNSALGLCLYDRRYFDPIILLNSLVTHPRVIVGGDIYDNFYWIPSSDFDGRHLPESALAYWLENLAARKRSEETLARSRDFYLTLFEDFPALIWRAGGDGACNYVNHSFLLFSGAEANALVGSGWLNRIHPADRGQFERRYRESLDARLPFEEECRLQRFDGEYRWVLSSGRPFANLEGQFEGFVGTCYDITDRKLQEDQLAYLATHDPLTGLPNRRILEDALRRVVARCRRGSISVLLFLDADNFKLVNDTLGHSAGDRVLVMLTQLLQERLRTEDLIVRLGGDEFAVLLESTTVEEAWQVADRIRSSVDEFRFVIDGLSFNLSFSIGLAVIDGANNPVIVLSQADAAMYRAKEEGRNKVVSYHAQDDGLARLSEANRLVLRLKEALKHDLFLLQYQPIVRLNDGQVEYYEALVRMIGEDGSIVSPTAFIPAAERFGLMPQLTRWIVREVVRTLYSTPGLRVSVNLSGLDLADETLPGFIEAQLQASSVEPDRLRFEITETAVIRDLVLAERWMRRLTELGCHFALDDFGTGFVSFVYLRKLPVDQIKIDGSFISGLDHDSTQHALVHAVQTLAHAQGKETVAEFVESEGIASVLRGIGVNFAQGYHYGKPNGTLQSCRIPETVLA